MSCKSNAFVVLIKFFFGLCSVSFYIVFFAFGKISPIPEEKYVTSVD